ncbi:MAG: anaerobic ribonucleoside-triphosphate reductase, partial [Clostridia bacterium]|nr:anaerobic ribonucleoside-triphosphate reductase [Clostridia bacterium]
TGRFAKMASIKMLEVRKGGQGKKGHKKPVLFPKVVFLYDENLHGKGKPLEDVFEAGIDCSMRSMYPDWLSLTGEGYVPSMYKKYGEIISPMGCRAFLSPYYERGGMEPADENDKPVFVGRFNIGVVSLHLPMIYAKAKQENKEFFEVLDYYLNLIRNLHLRTYDYLGEMRASTNPLAYCEGGFWGGNLGIHDKIKPLLKSATASFGITALNELQELHNKKSLVQDGEFALQTLQHINDKVNEFKKADGKLYAIYGTPAESLCGLQVTQFRKKYGVVENVSDREYVSNSFHCHVTEDITPIEKQDLENRFWNLCNGGKIQYVKYPVNYNREAVKTLVRRAMDMGFYEGVNMSLAYCDDCGYEELEMDVCPKCGSRNLTKIERMNGYLSYSRVKGDTRLNSAKMAEIAERKSM